MTPEEFEKALWQSPCDEFVAAVNVLAETERKPLLKVIKSVRKDVAKETEEFTGAVRIEDLDKTQAAAKKWQTKNPFVEHNIVLGVLACGTAAEAHRAHIWQLLWEYRALVPSVLIARNPAWLDTWVKKRLDGEFPELDWATVRQLLKAGVIQKPDSDGYMTLFIQGMRGYDRREKAPYVPTSERLKREPEYLEDEVWRIFEFENHALTTDWYSRAKDAPENYETWPDALVRLANEGDIDRDRLLDVTLASMRQEMKQNQLAAYGKLHEALKPGVEEMTARHQAYLDLLVSPTGPVVSFAVKMLVKLHRAGGLDEDLFVGAVGPVFSHKAKGTAMQALKILDKFESGDDKSFQKIAEVAITAMAHQSSDVQEFALRILEKGFAKANAATRESVERRIPFLPAKLQRKALELLGRSEEVGSAPQEVDDVDIDLSGALESLTPDLRNLVGIAGDAGTAMPPVLQYEVWNLPCVADREKLDPVETRDELLELAARLLEQVEAPDQVEILLHGISRFGKDRSGNFDKLAAPLAQRIEKGQPSSEGLCSGWGAVPIAFVDLLMTWWTGQQYDFRQTPYYDEPPQAAFAVARIREIQKILLGASKYLLLSLPSYTSGWLDPEDFAQRVLDRDEKQRLREYDLMQALLRLGPGNRQRALHSIRDVSGKSGRLARFALGGDERPKWTDRRDAHLWHCAARAREPEMNGKELLGPIAGKVPDMPGAFVTETWNWSVKVKESNGYRLARIAFDEGALTHIDTGNTHKRDRLKEARRKLLEPAWLKWPTIGLRTWPEQQWYSISQFSSAWRIHWLAMQHPADTESFMSVAVYMLDIRIDENTSRDTPAHAFFSAVFDPTRPWGEVTSLAVCLGLLSRSSDSRGYAIDALVPAIESGHADIHRIAEVFSKLLKDGAYKVNRFGPAMTTVLEASDLHKWWVGSLVDAIVGRLDPLPRNGYFLYEVALECMLPLNVRPSHAMATRLKEHRGSSKTAKLARELLSLEGPTIDEPRQALVSAAWLGRQQLASSFQEL